MGIHEKLKIQCLAETTTDPNMNGVVGESQNAGFE